MDVLFLDDDTNRQKKFLSQVPFAKIVATAQEAIEALKSQTFDVIFLDHDLGGEVFVDSSREDCGMEVVRFIATQEFANSHPKGPTFVVHSMNPVAGDDMALQLRELRYKTHRAPFGTHSFDSIAEQINPGS